MAKGKDVRLRVILECTACVRNGALEICPHNEYLSAFSRTIDPVI